MHFCLLVFKNDIHVRHTRSIDATASENEVVPDEELLTDEQSDGIFLLPSTNTTFQ